MKYSGKFKLQLVKFAEDSNYCAVSREFCVNEKLEQDWRRQVEKLKCMLKNKLQSEEEVSVALARGQHWAKNLCLLSLSLSPSALSTIL